MRCKLLLAVALGVAALWLAAPASAHPGGCYADVNGYCTAVRYPNDSPADMAAWGTTPDQHFAYLLTHNDDPAYNIVVMDFSLVKAQGLRACQQETNGMSSLNATYALQYAGGYTFEQANSITSAGDTEYCPWNGPRVTSPPPTES